MNNQKRAIIAAGGTGGHVLPGCNLALHLQDIDYKVELITDKRGYKFCKKNNNLKFKILNSLPIIRANIFKVFSSLFFNFISILRSIYFLLVDRPSIIFGMGGYASFPICIAATILRIRFVIYENNLVIGKANKYLLPFAKKILVSHEKLEGVPRKYENKVFKIGNILKKEIINFEKKPYKEDDKKLHILVLGGSQAAQIFAEKLPSIFKQCADQDIKLKIYQHCLPNQNKELSLFYQNAQIEFEIFNFSDNILDYLTKANLAITRSGSSMLAELTNANIPFISIPLPSSADNHQLKNAMYYQTKNFSFLIEEKDLNDKLFNLIKEIYQNNTILDNIILSQRQYSDKNVYNNINQVLKILFNEKN